ncbi:hypothetical protein FRC17_000285 [Serendipita sp. 399]|nr:hypothetical protein FRC17_000285 [Serendipita sp. 399]
MKPQPALLTSLVLTFEGSTEHYAKGQGYTATRLCSLSHSLVVRASPVAIPSTPDHKVAIIFDMAIPGWLPATLNPEDHQGHATKVQTRYRLHAKAIYQSEESSGLWLGSKTKYRDAKAVEVNVRRHRTTSAPKRCIYAIPSRSLVPINSLPTSKGIPKEVKAAIQARATIPNYIDLNDHSGRKTDDDEDEQAALELRLDLGCDLPGLTVHKFGVRYIQASTYSTTPDADFKRVFPLPTQQPPTVPLLTPHELDSLYMAGITFPANALRVDKDDILSSERPSVFNMQEGEQGHALDKESSSITVPLYLDRRARGLVKPSYVSPYVHVVHRLFVDLELRYQDGGHERVGFFVPLPVYDGPNFVSSPSSTTTPEAEEVEEAAPRLSTSSSSSIEGPLLPAYVQLYHSNGEAKYVAGLPAYSKECGPGEIRDESSGCHPVEFRRKHVRRGFGVGGGSGSTSSSKRSSEDSASSDSCSSSAGSDASSSSSSECESA